MTMTTKTKITTMAAPLLLLAIALSAGAQAFSPPSSIKLNEKTCFNSNGGMVSIQKKNSLHEQEQRQHLHRSLALFYADGDEDIAAADELEKLQQEKETQYITQSTLTLLEHVNLNVPTQQPSLDFYLKVLGCGLDPRKAENLREGAAKKTVWANAGASQFHLPYGSTGQVLRGHIGLRYHNLDLLRMALEPYSHAYADVTFHEKGVVRLTDHYGNQFACRQQIEEDDSDNINRPLTEGWQQPVIFQDDTDEWGEIATKFGLNEPKDDAAFSTNCVGIDYIEFHVPPGTAKGIAQFYNVVFDCTTSVLQQEQPQQESETDNDTDTDNTTPLDIAIIAVGNISPQGRADQSLIFKEVASDEPLPDYDGHHIALYVGQSAADFEAAFDNCNQAGVVWVNPRFSDKVTTIDGARQEQQYRFKNIVDLKTGKVLYELEHEVRSVQHPSFPGPAAFVEEE